MELSLYTASSHVIGTLSSHLASVTAPGTSHLAALNHSQPCFTGAPAPPGSAIADVIHLQSWGHIAIGSCLSIWPSQCTHSSKSYVVACPWYRLIHPIVVLCTPPPGLYIGFVLYTHLTYTMDIYIGFVLIHSFVLYIWQIRQHRCITIRVYTTKGCIRQSGERGV